MKRKHEIWAVLWPDGDWMTDTKPRAEIASCACHDGRPGRVVRLVEHDATAAVVKVAVAWNRGDTSGSFNLSNAVERHLAAKSPASKGKP